MKSQREQMLAVINDTGIDDKFKADERKKLAICNSCPDKNSCWDCGCHTWWKK